MPRQGLVKKQVQVTKNGKTFTQTVWVKPGDDPNTQQTKAIDDASKDKPKGLQELEDLFSKDKMGGLTKLKELGITWKENPHPAINLMRAKMAMKLHFGTSSANPDSKTSEKSKDEDTDKAKPKMKESNVKLLEELRSQGVTWNESEHPAINVMRAKMAAKKAGIAIDEKDDKKQKSEEKKAKEKELQEKKKKDYRTKRAKDRAEFKEKLDFFAKELNEDQTTAVRTVGIMPTDEKSRDYIEKFLSVRYKKATSAKGERFGDYTSKPNLLRIVGDLIPNYASVFYSFKGGIQGELYYAETIMKGNKEDVDLTDALVMSESFINPGLGKHVDPEQVHWSQRDHSNKSSKGRWTVRLKKLREKIQGINSPIIITHYSKALDAYENLLEDVDYNPLVINGLWRAVRKANSDDRDDWDEVYKEVVENLTRRYNNRTGLTLDIEASIDEFANSSSKVGDRVKVVKALSEITPLYNSLLLSARLETCIASNIAAQDEYVDGTITPEDIAYSAPCFLQGLDYKTGSHDDLNNQEYLEHIQVQLSIFDTIACMTNAKNYRRDLVFKNFETLKTKIINRINEGALSEVENCNSIIRAVEGDELDKIIAKIGKDFDTKHAVKDYKILNVFEIVDLPNVDEGYDRLKSDRGNERTLYHGTGSFATAAIIGKSGEFKIVEAKVGSMLGEGIYLADKTSKSALYISDYGYGKKGDQGTMMICDAVLGATSEDIHDDAHTVEALSGGNGRWSHLRNNEWCVKDPKAVRPRYMVHMEV